MSSHDRQKKKPHYATCDLSKTISNPKSFTRPWFLPRQSFPSSSHLPSLASVPKMQIHFSGPTQLAQTYNWILPIIIKAFFILIIRSRITGYTQTDPISRWVKKKKGRRSREDSHLISMSVEKCFILPEMKVAPLTSWKLISGVMKSLHMRLVSVRSVTFLLNPFHLVAFFLDSLDPRLGPPWQLLRSG